MICGGSESTAFVPCDAGWRLHRKCSTPPTPPVRSNNIAERTVICCSSRKLVVVIIYRRFLSPAFGSESDRWKRCKILRAQAYLMIPLLGISVEGFEHLVRKGEKPANRLIQPSELEYNGKCEEIRRAGQ